MVCYKIEKGSLAINFTNDVMYMYLKGLEFGFIFDHRIGCESFVLQSHSTYTKPGEPFPPPVPVRIGPRATATACPVTESVL